MSGPALLVEAVQRLSLARTLPDVQEIVRTTARRLCGADGATFVLREGDNCFYADEDAISPLWKGQRFPLESCISGWAMRERRAAAIADIYVDDRIPHDAYRPTFVKSLAMVPIRQMEPIGAIGNYWATQREPSEEDLALLQALADSTAVAIESVQLWADMEARVADRTAKLQEALKLNEHILGTMAHEINNALGGTVGFLDLLLAKDGAAPVDSVREYVELARRAATDGVRILEDQLAAAKDRAGALTVRPSLVDVADLLREIGATYSALRAGDAVAVVVDVDESAELPALRTDRHLLALTLRNLTSNALKFTDRGEVRLAAARDADGGLAISVADTGVGIAPADRARIFETWGQVDDEQAGRRAGSGLGLPFVRRVVDLLGGTLELESEPGRGTTFTIRLGAAAGLGQAPT